ncbi:MAG: MupA/Atu3671 family FMN-dependent luciferase-like monooxygenase [Pseudomonadota bacterium]
MLMDAGHRISAVVTRDARVRDWALGAGLDVHTTEDTLTDRFDWLLSIANTEIIQKSLLAKAEKGAINFHDGPLPRYAGLNAPVWALLNGEARYGITWHVIEGAIDAGRIVAQHMFDVAPDETALTLNAKCFSAAIASFSAVIAALDADLPNPRSQDLSLRRYFRGNDRPLGGGALDFEQTATQITQLVRALDHGSYRNPMSLPKLVLGDRVVLVRKADPVAGVGEPGMVLAADTTSVTIAVRDGAVRLSGLSDEMGAPGPAGLAPGVQVAPCNLDRIDAAVRDGAQADAGWADRFARYRPAVWCGKRHAQGMVQLPIHGAKDAVELAFALNIAALAGGQPVDLALQVPSRTLGAELGWAPVHVDPSGTVATARAVFAAERFADASPIAADLPARVPEITDRVRPDAALGGAGPMPGVALTLVDGTLHADLSRISPEEARFIADRVEYLAKVLPAIAGETLCADVALLPPQERDLLLYGWNATETEDADAMCLHSQIEAQVDRTPDAPALTFLDETLSYSDLDARANQVAHVLRRLGVGPNVPVALHVTRSVGMVVAALGILKAGGAYLPLDPAYPADRLAFCVRDSGAHIAVSESNLDLAAACDVLDIDVDPRIAAAPDTRPESTVAPSDLCYMIYTSGSTGQPKGVMVEHRNVANFFTGMDARVPHQDGNVMMAVTSLSFDISVLEIFWTLARGFKVVLSDEDKTVAGPTRAKVGKGPQFSLFFWGNDDGVGQDKYKLLLDGAQFADKNGFTAVWTPERHFHAFGGHYPNPSVTGAAVAAVTENISVRAGSCVAPLHHPARIAEEWSVIDNLTGGRAGIAFAAGWQLDDFVLRPENTPPKNKTAVFETLRQVRQLWSGDAVTFPSADGTEIACLTQPRPLSPALDAWVTTAGNPETWRLAGKHGCHVLTHLLGQTIEEVGEKIKIYHQALRDAGHDPDRFAITLLLHTFLAAERETARRIARGPMKDYLRSATDLLKQDAWAFPAFKRPSGASHAKDVDLDRLDHDTLEAILDFAFERYFERSGLFGTVDDALTRVEEVTSVGVTEIACLIDFGIDRQTVLDGLVPLAEVVKCSNAQTSTADHSLAASIKRHRVTHLQCTPYMARMLLTNDESRAALGGLHHMMIGGDTVLPGLVSDLAKATDAALLNMYGPTETTIWSTAAPLEPGAPVRIGAPIANTHVYILDQAMRPCPIGVAGELFIGGSGVARGYHGRDDLTAERFLEDPFRSGNRMFRTGDLARWDANGALEFLGRQDNQVKLRGYRIELAEIETALEGQSGVTQAAVIVRMNRADKGQLAAYYTGDATVHDVKTALVTRLPAFMVPDRIERLDMFPLTPNKKIDRQALGRTERSPPQVIKSPMPDRPPAQRGDQTIGEVIAEIWARLLNVDRIAPTDSFFDLGGHSLLALEAHRDMRDRLGLPELSVADIFRAPTLGAATALVETLLSAQPAKPSVPDAPVAQDRDATMRLRRTMRRARQIH